MPEAFEDFLNENVERHFAEVCAALRFPSVSALPDHRADLVATAQWIVERLHAVGVPEVELLQAGGHPVVFGRWIVDPQQPVAMVYGHYDVQPVDPLELWVTGPFEPTVRDGLLFARGAADNKGNIVAVIQAVEALVRTGAAGCPPVNLLFFFEGEEEIGSPTVVEAVRGALARMACDVVISWDGVMYAADKPSLTISCKGMLGGEIVVRTAAADLHSGLYGAVAGRRVRSGPLERRDGATGPCGRRLGNLARAANLALLDARWYAGDGQRAGRAGAGRGGNGWPGGDGGAARRRAFRGAGITCTGRVFRIIRVACLARLRRESGSASVQTVAVWFGGWQKPGRPEYASRCLASNSGVRLH